LAGLVTISVISEGASEPREPMFPEVSLVITLVVEDLFLPNFSNSAYCLSA